MVQCPFSALIFRIMIDKARVNKSGRGSIRGPVSIYLFSDTPSHPPIGRINEVVFARRKAAASPPPAPAMPGNLSWMLCTTRQYHLGIRTAVLSHIGSYRLIVDKLLGECITTTK